MVNRHYQSRANYSLKMKRFIKAQYQIRLFSTSFSRHLFLQRRYYFIASWADNVIKDNKTILFPYRVCFWHTCRIRNTKSLQQFFYLFRVKLMKIVLVYKRIFISSPTTIHAVCNNQSYITRANILEFVYIYSLEYWYFGIKLLCIK